MTEIPADIQKQAYDVASAIREHIATSKLDLIHHDAVIADLIAEAIMADREERPFVSAEFAGEQWCAFEHGSQKTSWMPEGVGDKAGWLAIAKKKPAEYQVFTRRTFAPPGMKPALKAEA